MCVYAYIMGTSKGQDPDKKKGENKMKKIEVKAWFSDWREVTEEEARAFMLRMMKGITTRSTFEGKAELIDGTHLRGITCAELLKK